MNVTIQKTQSVLKNNIEKAWIWMKSYFQVIVYKNLLMKLSFRIFHHNRGGWKIRLAHLKYWKTKQTIH